MNQWSLFKRSWSIFWRNKTLWVFGLLAALGGSSSNINFGFRNNTPLASLPLGGREALRQVFNAIDFNSLIAIGAVVAIVLFVISTFARAGLYCMLNAIEEQQPLSVSAGFNAAGKKFLPLLAVRLILMLPTIILGVIAAGSFVSLFSGLINESPQSVNFFDFGALGAIAGLGAVIAILSLLASAIGISAERAVVLDDLPVFGSIVRGWNYLWQKFADYFIIGLIWLVLAIGLGILFVCALTPILIAGIGPSFGSLRPGVNIIALTFNLVGPITLVAVIIGLLFGTFITIFETAVWTLAYRIWRVADLTPSMTV